VLLQDSLYCLNGTSSIKTIGLRYESGILERGSEKYSRTVRTPKVIASKMLETNVGFHGDVSCSVLQMRSSEKVNVIKMSERHLSRE
jgi:hypothetical protein